MPYINDYGQTLCDLVQDCLQHLPADRPSLTTLRASISAGLQANPMTAEDERWISNMLYGTDEPPAQVPDYVPRTVVASGNVISRRILLRGIGLQRLQYGGRGDLVEEVDGSMFGL